MQLFVKNWDGRTVAMRVEPQSTVAHLKSKMSGSVSTNDLVYVRHGCRLLSDSSQISECSGLRDYSTLILGLRCHGGGGDGGATGAESRDCYLTMYAEKKPDKIDPYEAILAKWTRCAISAEALQPPCVMDHLGNLYNKEVVVEALLTKKVPKKYRQVIKGLKDVIDIHLASIPGIEADDESVNTKFHCPIAGLEFNGKFRFVALKSCGHVLSEKALKEVKTGSCLVCYAPFTEADKIVINGTDEEVVALRERWEEEKLSSRVEAKGKKSRKPNSVETDGALAHHLEQETQSLGTAPAAHVSKRKLEPVAHVSEEAVVRPKGSDLIQQSKKFKAADVLLPQNATKKVYASIFTSSSKNSLRETYSCRSLPIGRN